MGSRNRRENLQEQLKGHYHLKTPRRGHCRDPEELTFLIAGLLEVRGRRQELPSLLETGAKQMCLVFPDISASAPQGQLPWWLVSIFKREPFGKGLLSYTFSLKCGLVIMLNQSVSQAEHHDGSPCNKFLTQELKREFQLTVLKPSAREVKYRITFPKQVVEIL